MLENLPQLRCQPTGSPLARVVEFHGVESDLHAMALRMGRDFRGGRKQGHGPLRARVLIKHADGPLPGLTLAVVDFPQVKHLPLYHAAGRAFVLRDTKVAVGFSVFEAPVGFEKHTAYKDGPISRNATPGVCTKPTQ